MIMEPISSGSGEHSNAAGIQEKVMHIYHIYFDLDSCIEQGGCTR